MTHALIVSKVGCGVSQMLWRLAEALNRPAAGYITKKEDELADEENGSPIYIYVPGQPRMHTPDNLMGYCKNHHFTTIEGAFDRWADRLGEPVEADHVIVLDTIGFMEGQEKAFCTMIMKHLNGEVPVIASVKDYDFPFLDAVKAHPNCRCFQLNRDNREACFEQVLAFMKGQLEER